MKRSRLNLGSPNFWTLLVLCVTILYRFPEIASAPTLTSGSSCPFPSEKLSEAARPLLATCVTANESGISVLCKSTQNLIKKICLGENQEIMSTKNFKIPTGEDSVGLEEFCTSVKQQDFESSAEDKEIPLFFQNFTSKEAKLSCFNLCKASEDEKKLNSLCTLFDASSKLLQLIENSRIAVPSESNSVKISSSDKPAPGAEKPEVEKNDLSQDEQKQLKIEAMKHISLKPDQQQEDENQKSEAAKSKTDETKQKNSKPSDPDANREIDVENDQTNNSAAVDLGVVKPGDSSVLQGKTNEKRNDERVPPPSGGLSSSSVKPMAKSREGVTNSLGQQEAIQKPNPASNDEAKQKNRQDSGKPANDDQAEDFETKNGEEVQDSPADDAIDQVLAKPDSSQNRKPIGNFSNKDENPVEPKKTSEPSKQSETDNQPDEEKKPELQDPEKEVEPKTPEEDKQPVAAVSKSSTAAPEPAIPVAKAPPTSKPKETEQQENQNEPPGQDQAQSQENNIQKVGDDYEEPPSMDNNDIPFRGPPSKNSQLGSIEDSNKVTFQDLDPELENSGYSFNYFVVFLGIIGVGFLLFLNKKRVIALLIEGRKPRGGRTRTRSVSRNGNGGGSSTSYRKLENNFE